MRTKMHTFRAPMPNCEPPKHRFATDFHCFQKTLLCHRRCCRYSRRRGADMHILRQQFDHQSAIAMGKGRSGYAQANLATLRLLEKGSPG